VLFIISGHALVGSSSDFFFGMLQIRLYDTKAANRAVMDMEVSKYAITSLTMTADAK